MKIYGMKFVYFNLRQKMETKMKINFYRIEQKKLDEKGAITIDYKGELEGSLKIFNGNIKYEGTQDIKLLALIQSPYEIFEVKKAKNGDGFDIEKKIYLPGSKEHINYIRSRAWQYGYLAEVES